MAEVTAAQARIDRILRRRGQAAASYWASRGRDRFARELTQDGLSTPDAEAILRRIDRELHPVEVGLDAVLADLRARHRPDVQSG